jgi:amidase
MSKRHWQDIAKEAQDYRDASINRVVPAVPEVPKDLPLDRTEIPKYLLSTEEVLLTQTAPEDLVKSLASGKITSTAVIKAFLRRAGVAQALVSL